MSWNGVIFSGLAIGAAAAALAAVELRADDRPAGQARGATASTAARSTSLPEDTDPMVLARYVDRVGDARILTMLSPEGTAEQRYIGALCARWLWAPEHALPALVSLMGGADPDVAPVAARSVLAIVERLASFELRERGADLEMLRRAVAELGAIAEAGRARRDIRYHAAIAAMVLGTHLPEPVSDDSGPRSRQPGAE